MYQKLYDARTKWYEIGMQLNVDSETLSSIESETDSEDHHGKCLRKMLTRRLQAVNLPLTWTLLCGCLRAGTVGRNDAAEKIEKWKGEWSLLYCSIYLMDPVSIKCVYMHVCTVVC